MPSALEKDHPRVRGEEIKALIPVLIPLDHPRVRGEEQGVQGVVHRLLGSPPRARGRD